MHGLDACVGMPIWQVLLRAAERVAVAAKDEVEYVAWRYLDDNVSVHHGRLVQQ